MNNHSDYYLPTITSASLQRWRNSYHDLTVQDAINIYNFYLPDAFTATNKGLFYQVNEHPELIINTLIIPVHEILEHHPSQSIHKLMLLAFRDGEQLQEITITPNEFDKMKWVRASWGFKTILNADQPESLNILGRCLQILISKIDTIQTFYSLGWHTSNCKTPIYVTGNQVLCRDDTRDQIQACQGLKPYTLPELEHSPSSCFGFVVNKMLLVAPTRVTIPALATQLLSLTTTLMQDKSHKPDFLFYLHGPTGSKKTSLSKIFFNMYENIWENVPLNFTSTGPAMENAMTVFRDTTLLIDDIPPILTPSEQAAVEKKLELLIRAYGDNVAKQKINPNKQLSSYKPGGLCAITAEDNIIKNPSSLARCYVVEISKNDIQQDMLTYIQKRRALFPMAITYFIKHIMNDPTKYIDSLYRKFINYRAEFEKSNSASHGRFIQTAAWLISAYHMYLNYGFSLDAINKDNKKTRLKAFRRILTSWIAEQSYLFTERDDATLFINAIKQLMLSKQIIIEKITVKENKKTINSSCENRGLIGYQDDKYLYLLPEIAYTNVQQFYSKGNLSFSVSIRTLLNQLFIRNILIPDKNKDGTKTVRVSINGQRISVIRLDLEVFKSTIT